jgi:hypothetical protein
MSQLRKHQYRLVNSQLSNALYRLAKSIDKNECYDNLRKLDVNEFQHLKDAAAHTLGDKHHYYDYPQMVLFESAELPDVKSIAESEHGGLIKKLYNNNVSGSGFWRTLKKVGLKAAKVYHKVNNAVGEVAQLAAKIPIQDPKYRAIVDSLATGTQLQDKVLTGIGA